jgi:hypothetical protein
VALPNFKHNLSARNVIAAVSINEDQASKTVLEEILKQSAQEVEIRPRWSGQRSGEIEVMIRIPEPGERREQDPIGDALCSPVNDFAQEQAVGEERQVMSVLLERGDGKHDRYIFVEGLDRRPR